ncbi:hypothetical protein KPH14_009709 [Odynerus spinipes]|uniref:Ubiquitin-like-conjugating enzyme ATG10 n=1 Tax=Odynerus spinipes TaxID=1348599 RepID=A0AAD9RQ62_9HYME|nr:hypothetical protein KPH14_009709 [Odynerus spinipes]
MSEREMDGPGTISWDEFLENAKSFVTISDQISDGWQLRGEQEVPAQAYLVRQKKHFILNETTAENSSDTENWAEQLCKDPYEAPTPNERPLVVEHHILWSMSYSVPVLYFNGWKSDFPGINRISVEEAQGLVNGSTLNYSELSQSIHPILGTPYLQLHPCMSHELLQYAHKSKNKLISWLSFVAPAALRLDLRQEYYELTL